MFRLAVLFLVSLIVSPVAAFAPRSFVQRASKLSMSAEDLAGALPPLGYFDPLGLSSGKTVEEVRKIREAELKHGRVAMVAFLGILTGENFNPLFDGKITGTSILLYSWLLFTI